jgi:hypothetical protein
MYFLWGTNWFSISQKTAFFIFSCFAQSFSEDSAPLVIFTWGRKRIRFPKRFNLFGKMPSEESWVLKLAYWNLIFQLTSFNAEHKPSRSKLVARLEMRGQWCAGVTFIVTEMAEHVVHSRIRPDHLSYGQRESIQGISMGEELIDGTENSQPCNN